MFSWLLNLSKRERRTMTACFSGWVLDAFDVQIYSFVMPTLLTVWTISKGQAGLIGTITLLISAFGDSSGHARAFARKRIAVPVSSHAG